MRLLKNSGLLWSGFVCGLALTMSSCGHTLSTWNPNYYQEGALSWFQRSGEAKALQLMAYNVAGDRLKQIVQEHKKKMNMKKSKTSMKPLAVVLDLDETVVDNSFYQVTGLRKKTSYPVGWTEWVLEEKATLIPGAEQFLQDANQMGVEIFYITNRKVAEEQATINNLLKLKVPIKKENLFVRTKESGKEARRSYVSKTHEIVLLIGDNLNDFSDIFEQKKLMDRDQMVVDQKEAFGRKWIVLPNPLYGDWESAIYDYDFKKTMDEKAHDRQKLLIGIEQL
jgi:5'-nucleotidase (lipoprotein e(P4) family)